MGLAPSASAAGDCGSGFAYTGYSTSTAHLDVRLYVRASDVQWCANTFRHGSWTDTAGTTYVALISIGPDDYATRKSSVSSGPAKVKSDCVSFYGYALRTASSNSARETADSRHVCFSDLA